MWECYNLLSSSNGKIIRWKRSNVKKRSNVTKRKGRMLGEKQNQIIIENDQIVEEH